MQVVQLLKTIHTLWAAEAELTKMKSDEKEAISKIQNDPKRTKQDKIRGSAAFYSKLQLLDENIKTAKSELLAQSQKDTKLLIRELINKSESVDLESVLHSFTKIAYFYEKNGDAELHAKKLASVFKSKTDALKYLMLYASAHPQNKTIIHDACLFNVPEPSVNQHRWLALARQNHGTNLLNPSFLNYLRISKDIDKRIAEDQVTKNIMAAKVLKKYRKTDKAAVLALINKKIQQRKSYCDKYAAGQIDKLRRHTSKEKNKIYLKDLEVLYTDRHCLNLDKSFEQYSLNDIADCYSTLIAGNPSRKIFIRYGLDESTYQRFTALDRSVAGKNIPDVLFDCGNGYYIKKLNVRDDIEAAYAACLGVITDCCQSLSGVGEPCAIHGLTSEDSGFYVLFKGNAKKPNINDAIYAQSWVNRTASGTLVFDSIESSQADKSKKIEAIVQAAYHSLANDLIKRPDIPKVHCGVDSGVSVGMFDVTLIPEDPINYYDYRDSHEQCFLAAKKSCYSLTPDGKVLFDQDTWISELLKCEKNKKVTDVVRHNIRWALSNNIEHLLTFPPHTNIAKRYFTAQASFKQSVRNYISDCRNFTLPARHEDIDYNLLVTGRTDGDKRSVSVAMAAAIHGDSSVLSELVARNIDVNFQNEWRRDALFYFQAYCPTKNKNSDCRNILIDAKADLNHCDTVGNTPLRMAVVDNNIKDVKTLLEAKANINQQADGWCSAIENATWNYSNGNHPTPKLLHYLIASKADVNLKNCYGNTPIMDVIRNNRKFCIETMKILIDAKADLNFKNNRGQTPLMRAKEYAGPEVVKFLEQALAQRSLSSDLGRNGHAFFKNPHTESVQLQLDGKTRAEEQRRMVL